MKISSVFNNMLTSLHFSRTIAISLVAVTAGVALYLVWPPDSKATNGISISEQAQRPAGLSSSAERESRGERSSTPPRMDEIAGDQTLARIRAFRASSAKPSFVLFREDGLLPSGVSAKLGLDEEETDYVQKSASDFVQKIRETAREYSAPVEPVNPGELERYEISPFEAGLSEPFNQFAASLVGRFGRNKAGKILTAIPAEQIYGECGRCSVVISVKSVENGEGDHRIMQQEYIEALINPIDGSSRGTSHLSEQELDARFPGVRR